MNETTWPPEWIRGALAHSVLAIVAAEGTTYGYRISQRLEAAGLGKVKGGTLYPILARLENDGLVTSAWGEGDGGPGRKFVSITDTGRAEVARHREAWDAFARLITELWDGTADEPA